MPMIALLLASSVVTVIAVIGLADGLAHLLGWTARSLKEPQSARSVSLAADAVRRDRLVA